jgi:hypothetical protein
MTNTEKNMNIAIQALRDIAYPIDGLRRQLKVGEQLAGIAAVSLSNDSNYLKQIALKALAEMGES